MAIGTGTAILGGAALGAFGSKKAGDAAKSASNAATAEQRRQFNLMREDYAPFRETGLQANNRLWELLQDPNYVQNIAKPGINAIDSSAAARGLYGSTGHLSDIANHVSNNAQGEYLNRLASLAGYGQSATNSMSQMGQGYANNIAQGIQNAGNARASSYLGMGNALANMGNQYMMGRGMGMFGGGSPTNIGATPSGLPQMMMRNY